MTNSLILMELELDINVIYFSIHPFFLNSRCIPATLDSREGFGEQKGPSRTQILNLGAMR